MILRPSSDGELNPADRYFEMGDALTKLFDAGVPEILLLPDSEPNLHGRPMPSDYWNRIATFFLLVDKQFSEHNRSGRLKYVSPPMAVAQGEEAWLSAATVKRMQGPNEGETENFLTANDGFGLHAYGQLDESLVDHVIALAEKYAPGIPIVASEVGDSSNADPSTKAEAIIRYLKKLERAGAYAACLFIVGSNDPQWSTFILLVDQIRHIAASVPQEVPMPVETVFQVQTPTAGATVIAGQTITVNGRVLGVDGQGMLTATLIEDTRPGTPQYGEPTNVRGIPIAADGWFSFSMQVPNSTEVPASATLVLSTTEIDLAAFQRGEGWGDAAQKSVPVVIARVSAVPVPVPPPATTDIPPYLHTAYHGLHEAELAAQEAGDTLLLHEIQQGIAVIDRRKAGDFR